MRKLNSNAKPRQNCLLLTGGKYYKKKKLHKMKVMVLRAVSTAMFKIFMQNTKISHIFISVLK